METKATMDGAQKSALGDLLYTFEQFKQANDARLNEIETRGAVDPLLSEKIERIDQALMDQKGLVDRLSAAVSRGECETQDLAPASEEKSAFDIYIRSGNMTAPALKSIAASDASGAIIAPVETATLIDAGLKSVSPIRQIATVRQISGNTYRKPVATAGFASGWASESGARAETTTPTLQAIDFPAMELYAMPATTQTLLDDAAVDVSQWIADEVQTEFAVQESSAFIAGDGTNKPRGILNYTTAPDAGRAFDELGTALSAGAAIDGDDLLDLIYTLDQSYRLNGRFIMNRKTASAIRKLKDADGNYLWAPGLAAGVPSTLLGYPVTESEDMPDPSVGVTPVAFGDFSRGYLIVDRAGIEVLRDPFSAKPFVLFYTTKRVGGGVQDYSAIKFLEMSA